MLAMWDCCRSSPVEWCNRFVSFGLGYVALRIVGCGGGVRSVPGIVGSVVGRRPHTGVRLGSLINQNSHAIRVPELCAAPENVAIPTVRFQRLTYVPGNCVRHF